MRKLIAERTIVEIPKPVKESIKLSEKDYERKIMEMPLQSNSLHDRIGEML
jgi:hypothetical protein